MSPKDIVRTSPTCTHLTEVSGNYLNECCPQLNFCVKSNRIRYFEDEGETVPADFYPYIRKLRVECGKFERKALFLRTVTTITNFGSLQSRNQKSVVD